MNKRLVSPPTRVSQEEFKLTDDSAQLAWGLKTSRGETGNTGTFVLCKTIAHGAVIYLPFLDDSTMPEGPELYKNSQMVNEVCKGLIFSGKIVKSAVSTKNPDVKFPARDYTIHAESRGKEMALILTSLDSDCKRKGLKQENGCKQKRLRILFRFGMSGKFTFGSIKDIHKHAHLNFYTKDKPLMVLSFVDVRRFGRWELTDVWSKDRGPDPMFEYEEFRSNVLENLKDRVFDKPLCEVMHNQKYFNGIGNYLRAEIIFRAGIPPFSCARSVFEKLIIKQEKGISKMEECSDLLQLCNLVPIEVINLPGKGYDPSGQYSDYSAFNDWLRCYYNPEMRNMVDHDGRTMWFKGEAGPMVPKDAKSRGIQKPRKRKPLEDNKEIDDVKIKTEETPSPPKKTKTASKPEKTITSKKENSKKKSGQKQRKTKPNKTLLSKSKKVPVRRSLRVKKN